MDYVIKNHNNLYIKLDNCGRPITCTKQARMTFEYSKAMNILDNLPKTLKKLNFKVEAISDIKEKLKENVLRKEDYIPSENVTRWIEKFGICDEVINEARNRKEELEAALSIIDKKLNNILHKIELEKPKNACEGFKDYKLIKDTLNKRRIIKDEMMIISNVLRMNFKDFNKELVNKSVAGLKNRVFTMRFVEGDEENVM